MWIHKKIKSGTLLIKDINEKGNPYNKEDLYIHSINKEIKLLHNKTHSQIQKFRVYTCVYHETIGKSPTNTYQ